MDWWEWEIKKENMTEEEAHIGSLICKELEDIRKVIGRLKTDFQTNEVGGYIYVPHDLTLINRICDVYEERKEQLELKLKEL